MGSIIKKCDKNIFKTITLAMLGLYFCMLLIVFWLHKNKIFNAYMVFVYFPIHDTYYHASTKIINNCLCLPPLDSLIEKDLKHSCYYGPAFLFSLQQGPSFNKLVCVFTSSYLVWHLIVTIIFTLFLLSFSVCVMQLCWLFMIK
jgi:hypothetical protein